jgi:hypothetical protein
VGGCGFLHTPTTYDSTRGGWCSKEVTETFGVGAWKHIRSGWEKFSKFVRFDVWVGSKAKEKPLSLFRAFTTSKISLSSKAHFVHIASSAPITSKEIPSNLSRQLNCFEYNLV